MEQQIDISRVSPDFVKQEILKKTITSPLTILPISGALPACAAFFIFDAGWMALATGAVLIATGVGNFAYEFFGNQNKVSKYFNALQEENEQLVKKKLDDILAFLTHSTFPDAALQVAKLQESMASFEKVLARKFTKGEFAQARYHSLAEQVYLNALANLEKIVAMLEAIDSIDINSIDRQLHALALRIYSNTDINIINEKRIALEERKEIKIEERRKINVLLAQNEKALTELERIASKLAAADVNGERIEANLTEAIANLNRLSADTSKIWG
jgi:hypothetical protein